MWNVVKRNLEFIRTTVAFVIIGGIIGGTAGLSNSYFSTQIFESPTSITAPADKEERVQRLNGLTTKLLTLNTMVLNDALDQRTIDEVAAITKQLEELGDDIECEGWMKERVKELKKAYEALNAQEDQRNKWDRAERAERDRAKRAAYKEFFSRSIDRFELICE